VKRTDTLALAGELDLMLVNDVTRGRTAAGAGAIVEWVLCHD
jgi:hypothetical protein